MNNDLTDLKKGDQIVRFGVIHKISQIKDGVIHFEPLYKNRRNETLKLSIPLDSLDKTSIRLPVTKTELKEELKFLRQAEYQKASFNRLKVKRSMSDNQLHDMGVILKTLWEEKRDEDKNFTISKRNTYGMVLSRFKQEVALVLEMNLEEAEEKVETALETGWKRKLRLEEENEEKDEDDD